MPLLNNTQGETGCNSVLMEYAPPPLLFKRLDSFLKQQKIRAHDAFNIIDENRNKHVSYPELLEGFQKLGYTIQEDENEILENWVENEHNGQFSYKQFALALKQRASHTPTAITL